MVPVAAIMPTVLKDGDVLAVSLAVSSIMSITGIVTALLTSSIQ